VFTPSPLVAATERIVSHAGLRSARNDAEAQRLGDGLEAVVEEQARTSYSPGLSGQAPSPVAEEPETVAVPSIAVFVYS
jgi:hypothetical protein